MASSRILVVRLGAMGDVLHALPAVASLKQSYPHHKLTWVIEPKWAPLLEGNPFVDQIELLDRSDVRAVLALRRRLREARFDFAIDLQGLLKSALVAAAARPERIFGFDRSELREPIAGLFYSHSMKSQTAHVVDRNLELVESAGANNVVRLFPIPAGRPEGVLPTGDFVLANPLAGWASKQWPLENYAGLAELLKRECALDLVLNVPAATASVAGTHLHVSALPGLIHATRRAVAVIGVDSGPMHLAAALGKPGVAIFGPTDAARNGPYGGSFTVLRAPHAVTSYKRRAEIDSAMREISVDAVFESLKARMYCRTES